ncbi:MAG: DUF1330 domain-containing protein [Longimicrobiales bacterium]
MPAYAIFDNLEVLDPESLAQYKDAVAPVVERYRGRYLALGGRVDRMEGSWIPTFPVIIEFPSLEDAHRWYASDDYRDLKALRLSAVRSNAVFVEGLLDYRGGADDESFRGS